MPDFKKGFENLKDSAAKATEKINQNETFNKVKQSATEFTEKVNSNETVINAKEKAKEVSAKVQENEKVAATLDKINDNKYVQKAKKSKHYKLIKIGAAVLAIVLVFALVNAIFGGNKHKVEKQVETVLTQDYEHIGAKNVKIDAKVIAQNKGSHLYLLDIKGSWMFSGSLISENTFVIVDCSGKNPKRVYESEYYEHTKEEQKEVALSHLSKG